MASERDFLDIPIFNLRLDRDQELKISKKNRVENIENLWIKLWISWKILRWKFPEFMIFTGFSQKSRILYKITGISWGHPTGVQYPDRSRLSLWTKIFHPFSDKRSLNPTGLSALRCNSAIFIFSSQRFDRQTDDLCSI